ncbi:MAG TPA: PilZ domain-containing protein [Gaiellaceae bacterium]|nr:PilZ domain-containing protein [Gaiellaceae bacterium]
MTDEKAGSDGRDERRASPRHAAHLAGELESAQGNSAIAITRDVSAGGLAVFTRLSLQVGASVKLLVLWNDEQVILHGTVLRQESLEPGESTLWRTRAAIAIDPKDPGLAKIVAALAETA